MDDRETFVSIEKLFSLCAKKSVESSQNLISSLLSQVTLSQCWETLSSWLLNQTHQGRSVNLPSFGLFGVIAGQESKQIGFIPHEVFLSNYSLSFRSTFQGIETEPNVKVNYGALAKLNGLDKALCTLAITSIIAQIGELLSRAKAEVDLGSLGRLRSVNREITFLPVFKEKGLVKVGKSSVKRLMEMGKSYDRLPPIEKLRIDVNKMKEGEKEKEKEKFSKTTSRVKLMDTREISREMLAAGLNPQARVNNYSSLASDPAALLATRFKKPKFADTKFPPVLDVYSRTLASPMTFNKQYIPVSARIASFYSPFAKRLVIDKESRSIKFIPEELIITLQANLNPLIPMLPTSESSSVLKIWATGTDSESLRKDYNEKRYKHYIENEISTSMIAPMNQVWITEILKQVPADWRGVEGYKVEELLEQMTNEINNDYYIASRKSILDYVLKDSDQSKRLGIEYNPCPPIEYGEEIFEGINIDEWQTSVMEAKIFIADNLCTCYPASVSLMTLWTRFDGVLLVSIPSKYDIMMIEEFCERQENILISVQSNHINTWLIDSEKAIIEEVTRSLMDSEKASMFYEAACTMMSIQLRQLITDSIKAYMDFFLSFDSDKNKLPRPPQMIENIPNDWPNAFLKLRMIAKDTVIDFSDSADKIIEELVQVIYRIIEKFTDTPRPEKTLTKNSGKMTLWNVEEKDEIVLKAEKIVRKIAKRNLKISWKALELYQKYSSLLTDSRKIDVFLHNNPNSHTRAEFTEMIMKYELLEREIRATCPIRIRLNMVEVDCSEINKSLCKECDEIIKKLNNHIMTRSQERAQKLSRDFDEMTNKLKTRADTEQKLVDSENYKEKCRIEEIPRLFRDYEDIIAWFKLLYQTPFQVSEENLAPLKNCNTWVKEILTTLSNAEQRLQTEKDDLSLKLKETRNAFWAELNNIEQEIAKHRNDSEEALHKGYAEQIASLKLKLEKDRRQMEEIHDKEIKLGWSPTEFTKLEEARLTIEPYEELWTLVGNFQDRNQAWILTNIKDLDPDEIEREVKQMQGKAKSLMIRLKEKAPKLSDVALLTSTKIDKFMKNIPTMKIVSTKGLTDRHFEKISKILELPPGAFKVDSNTTFKMIQHLDFGSHIEEINEISVAALREYNNYKQLEKMEKDWESVKFELKEKPEQQTFILTGVAIELIETLLEDQILNIQAMKGSPFAAVYIDRILKWDNWLQRAQEIIKVWLEVQKYWISLEPVFGSADIQKALNQAYGFFKLAEDEWKRIMSLTFKDPTVRVVTEFKDLYDKLSACLEKFVSVQKSVNNFLESKRVFFPRFFFLSNDELLSILKETRDPTQVQPHLKKCFEGIKSLRFDSEKRISAMISPEGEMVELEQIDPSVYEGAVEKWLQKVEEEMIVSTKKMISNSVKSYNEGNRSAWVGEHIGQAVLCCSMYQWTINTESRIDKNSLDSYLTVYNNLLSDIVNLVRGEIDPLLRCTLKALIVLDVHCRDVIEEMVFKGVNNKDDFTWQCQLRYYYEADDRVTVKVINAVLDYTFEYLGNSERLVITPLTDRCYRTLCGAISLLYGGAPEGPAGTGKTETVKDLAKALARMCVVFNCSDGLDYKAMGKFFRGLASTGGWCCLDEFNRIDPEVLSVVAQQLLQIQNAVRENLQEFNFEGNVTRLLKTCNAFITMNPGYAGRSELPDNLKALFRTVAMMVPDYSLIAENVLYSYGFHNARVLAQKIVATYKLCSEQLSSQKHYDYGMRAVKSVLTAAGALKRRYPEENEVVLMLRSINDVNLAKFLSHDLPLFEGIISDLFPGIELPEPDYNHLRISLSRQCVALNLQEKDYFFIKIIQLYEMIQVRHGLMVVGLPFSGKSSALKVLAKALTDLASRNLMNESEVILFLLNPKSISLKQLYGDYDPVGNDWKDGVLSAGFKTLAKNESKQRKWLQFDGPVDALWIENMNTVLDDNKKLCLPSGEIVAMSNNMNLIFEVMDLAVASPATVSRCGMIYMEPNKMGWEPIYQSWKTSGLPKTFLENEEIEVNLLVDWLVEPTLKQVESKMKMIAPMMRQNLLVSLLRFFSTTLDCLADSSTFEKIEEKDRIKMIDCLFVFSLVWSVGACIVDRRNFNIWMRRILNGDVPEVKNKGKKILPAIPENGNYYDYVFLPDGKIWKHWAETGFSNINEQISTKLQPNEVIVPTTDTVRYTYLLEKMIRGNIPHVFCGKTGTGKTVYVKDVINNKLESRPSEADSSAKIFINVMIGFSAQTGSNQVQDTIDSKLDIKRGKGVFGPRPNEICVIFIDDMNMPESEEYGAQPPIEILRQLLDQGGWYDRKENLFKKLIDFRFISAMGTPGGGRTYLTPRFMRHLSLISLTDFEDDTLLRIFSSILHSVFVNNKFSENVIKLENKIVQASRDIYKTAMEKLLPTPLKSHYTFNLRDFSKVILGICMADPTVLTEGDQVIRLWVHEIFKVFGDRLVDETDQLWLLGHVRDITKRIFGMNFDTVFNHLDFDKNGKVETIDEIRHLMFGYLLNPLGSAKKYIEMRDFSKMQKSCESSLELFNLTSKKPMDLVLFSFAIEHLSRISRIINQSGGHALLVGVGGSGRQSLTRLAVYMSEFSLFEIELKKGYNKADWNSDLQALLKKAGGQGEPTIFLLTDSHIKDKSFLEDINTLLNTGEVPNLFAHEDKVELIEMVRGAAKAEANINDNSISQLFTFFVSRCKKNLHIVLCFSPIGEAFRTRLRMFPSLVNCCTIDWFTAWPANALVSVASTYFKDLDIDDSVKLACVEMCQEFHSDTQIWSKKMQQELKRHYYVTPTSYLELIKSYKSLLNEKRKEISAEKIKFEVGYQKLINTESSVGAMQLKLTKLQPDLELAKKKAEEQLIVVEANTKDAEVMEESVKEQELIARQAADEAEAIKRECDQSLTKCMPLLEEANQALKVIQKDDISSIKKMANPPSLIKDIMEAVCILFDLKPTKKQNPVTMKMEPQWWECSLRVLSQVDFLNNLIEFHKDEITENQIKQLQRFVNDPLFNKEHVRNNVSEAAAGLCAWVLALEKYYHVNQDILPKRKRQQAAEEDYNTLMRALEQKENDLRKVQNEVAKLQNDLNLTISEKERLEREVENCRKQLERAQKLIESMGGEKIAWTEKAKKLGEVLISITGDLLIAAGTIAYLGPFTSGYRTQIIEKWVLSVKSKHIPSSESFSLQGSVGNPVVIRSWNIDGLPRDSFSIDNAVIMSKSSRWPLLIDPESQANKWIKKMENKDETLMIIKLADKDFLKKLERKITYGQPVLLENVGEELDPSLEPLLLKQIVKNVLKLGDSEIEYNKDFRFYITTRLRNPHYMPELSTKVALINFMITQEGLADQLLVTVVAEEQPELAKKREQLILQFADNQKKLKTIQEKILLIMSTSSGNILDDDEAINVLSQSKTVSNQIELEQESAKITEVKIEETRVQYSPFTDCISRLFFCITDLSNIDPMYQYSLDLFNSMYLKSIRDTEKSEDLATRLNILEKTFTKLLYINISRSLFEKDRLLFSFNLCLKFMEYKNELDADELRFLVTGGTALDDKYPPAPEASWLTEKSWNEICRLSKLENFAGFFNDFKERINEWKEIFDSANPAESKFPGYWNTKISDFQKLLVLRCIRQDCLIGAITEFVAGRMGKEFVTSSPLKLKEIYLDSNRCSPLIFILSPGSDPFRALKKLAESTNKTLHTQSLGQGQGAAAEATITSALENGSWVLLMNCHLAESWMGTLEQIVQNIQPDSKSAGKEFRLWLTSYPSAKFPVTLLQNGIKMTNEPPKGLKSNLAGSFTKDFITDPKVFNGCKREKEWKKLLFGLCFFNAVIQERRLYGALGWNIPYEFSESDLRISVQQLRDYLDLSPKKIPFEALKYLAGECNFGGRVTDDKDRRLIMTLLEDYYNEDLFKENYRFAGIHEFFAPTTGDHNSFMSHIEALPSSIPPEIYGFHPNAEMTKNQNEAVLMFNSMLLTQGTQKTSASQQSPEQIAMLIAENILHEPPELLDEDYANKNYPPRYAESMNTVLTQEVIRFNNLTKCIRNTLADLTKAVTGQISMSGLIEATIKTLFDGKVPKVWKDVSYPSLKPLAGYISDLKTRIEFFKTWILKGQPEVFEISRFFFTQSFLTGSLQNYSRKMKIPIDLIKFNFEVTEMTKRPEDGVVIKGLFLEGARWDYERKALAESHAKVLYTACPAIWLKPSQELDEFPHYDCPVYKTSERRGELSTTGHSTNFVMFIRLNSEEDQKHWIKRGVALLTQLND